MTIPLSVSSCRTCGAADLGTNFCESCGAKMVRDGAAPWSSVSATRGVGGLPLGLFLGGLVAAAILSMVLTLTYYGSIGPRLVVGFDAGTLIADAVAVCGLWLAGAAGSARTGLRVLGFVIALLNPVLDIVSLAADATNAYSFYYTVARGAFLLFPVLTVLAWLLATGRPARAYFSLFISGGAGFVANFLVFGVAGVLGTIVSTAGIVVAVVVANHVGPSQARSATPMPAPVYSGVSAGVYSGPDASYAAIGRPQTTNGFAVSALVFGLIGGTILPIVFGHVALAQIGRTGERGRGMAIAGLILGYLSLTIVIIIVIVVAVAAASRSAYY